METIANICKGTENLGNNQTDLKLNAFEVGENLVAFLIPPARPRTAVLGCIIEGRTAITTPPKSL